MSESLGRVYGPAHWGVTGYHDVDAVPALRRAVADIMAANAGALPAAHVFVKPNLNNDLCALTGNATDLRLLAAVIESLQERGCGRITVGDGPNIGTYRKGIDVLQRLGVRALCAHYGVECLDLNHAPTTEVQLATGPVRVARICREADFFLNVPKLKTHAEAGMSLALKSLIGCVAGTDKRCVHTDLPANIVALNGQLRPALTIVDALVAMEGNGPGDGTPRRLDMLFAAREPFLLDLAVAQLFGLHPGAIPYLQVATRQGYIEEADREATRQLPPLLQLELPPPRGRLARLLDSRLLTRLRDRTRAIHGQEWARRLLYRLRIMQDVYEGAEPRIERAFLDREACDECGRCLAVCPMTLPVTTPGFDFWASADCVQCLYCAFVCPREAIAIAGDIGYLAAHLERYGKRMRLL